MVECRYYGACRYASGNCSNGGNDAPDCEDFRQMPDTNALLALADEMERNADTLGSDYGVAVHVLRKHAEAVRRAVGA